MTDLGKPALVAIEYPEADGQPMRESDAMRDYLIYCVETLRLYFQSHRNVYASGNLFIYYEEANLKAVMSKPASLVTVLPWI